MFGGILGVQELILLAVVFGLAVALPVTIVLVVVHYLRRESPNRGGG